MVWMLTSFGVGCGITWVVAGVGSSGPYPTWDLKAPEVAALGLIWPLVVFAALWRGFAMLYRRVRPGDAIPRAQAVAGEHWPPPPPRYKMKFSWDAFRDAGCDVTENEDGSISVKVPVGGIEMKADG